VATQLSRYVCPACTKEIRNLVICDGPVCKRCARFAKLQHALTDEPPDPNDTRDADNRTNCKIVEHFLAKAAARGLFAGTGRKF